jgi:hypothetical protein
LWQGMLLGVAGVAIAWLALIVAFGILHAASAAPALFTGTGPLPWIAACTAAALGLGAATSRACMSLVQRSAEREKDGVAAGIKERITAVAKDMVIMPAEQELSEFERFRDEVRIAEHGTLAAPAS